MALKLITGPVVEPVSLEEAKLHLRVDLSDDDYLIDSLLRTAREYAEDVSGRAFCSQTWELVADAWPGDRFVLPRPPLVSVTSIKYTDEDGTEATFSSSYYTVDTDSEPGKVVLKSTASWPSVTLVDINGIRVRYVCGYGATAGDVPQRYRHAILLLAGHWYENREAIATSGAMPKEIPAGVTALLWMERVKGF